MGLDGWLWVDDAAGVPTSGSVYCRLNQRPYAERHAENVDGFRVCNRISSREDGESQFSAFYAYA